MCVCVCVFVHADFHPETLHTSKESTLQWNPKLRVHLSKKKEWPKLTQKQLAGARTPLSILRFGPQTTQYDQVPN